MGDIESALASGFWEGFLQEVTCELSHLTSTTSPVWGGRTMAVRKSSPESQLADGKLGLGPGRPEFSRTPSPPDCGGQLRPKAHPSAETFHGREGAPPAPARPCWGRRGRQMPFL